MSRTIWIVNQFASHLEERHLNLSAYFAEKGYNVVVITASFHHGRHVYLYQEETKAVEKQRGVTYVYLKAKPQYMTGAGKRTLHMLDFCYRFDKYRKQIAESFGKPDFIIASSAPPFVWEIGYRAAKKYHAKFIAEFRDIWPLSLVEVQGTSANHPFVKLLEVVEKRAYKHADAIVGTMPYAYKHVCDELGFPRSKVHWMPNGLNVQKAERALTNPKLTLPKELDDFLSSHWCCVYIGSIVKSESVDYIIEAWMRVKDERVCMAVIGDGNKLSEIEQLIQKCDGARIRHFPSITTEQIPLALEKAGCCLAALPDFPIYRFGLSMNKLSDYLYSGKPVVFACSFDNVVKDAGGLVVPFGDKQAMADAIERAMAYSDDELKQIALREKKIIRTQYDYREIAKKYLEMMESL